jgi:hypothetical protein
MKQNLGDDNKFNELEPLKLSPEEIDTLKLNERLIVHLLEKVIDLGNELINEELRQQLLDSYLSLNKTYKAEHKAINYLLKKYGFDIKLMLR